MPILGVEAREHDKPQEVVQDLPESRRYLMVDGLLSRSGVIGVRYMRVNQTGEIQAPDEEARRELGRYVDLVDDSTVYLTDGIGDGLRRNRRDSGELNKRPLQYRRSRWHRRAEQAASLLGSSGSELRVMHELYPGHGEGAKIWTANNRRFTDTSRMVAGVEAKISDRLVEMVPDKKQRARVAAGLLGIAVGEARRDLRK